ncbi:Nucleic acid-binding protein [Corchorus capsularis]|uniref:Nucleic acid-binding protein n=1 Tax=Corchorus capsularis TaxID=210143 RepID=A0A1R3GGX2_COCAP|nr:Nucleic acid-binding protein [Corchorus capsularis]
MAAYCSKKPLNLHKTAKIVETLIVQDYQGHKFIATSSASTLFVNPSIKEVEEIKTRSYSFVVKLSDYRVT